MVEARRILHEGVRRWEGGGVLLDVWHPVAGCYRKKEEGNGRYIWLYGLLVHLWSKTPFEKIEDLCGGLKAVESSQSDSWEWAKSKVRWPKMALVAFWLSNGMLGYIVAIWKRELPEIIAMAEIIEKTNNPNFDKNRLVRGWRKVGDDSKFESHEQGKGSWEWREKNGVQAGS